MPLKLSPACVVPSAVLEADSAQPAEGSQGQYGCGSEADDGRCRSHSDWLKSALTIEPNGDLQDQAGKAGVTPGVVE